MTQNKIMINQYLAIKLIFKKKINLNSKVYNQKNLYLNDNIIN